jgi:hypothetical protein
MQCIRNRLALAAALAACLAGPGRAHAAQSFFRFSGGISTVDQPAIGNPGAAEGVELEIGMTSPLAIVLGLDFAQWKADGTSPYVTGSKYFHDFAAGLRFRWPDGSWRPYADLLLVSGSGDFRGKGFGAAAGAGLSWGRGGGPRIFIDGRGTITTDMDNSLSLFFARAGVAIPFAR